MSCELHSVSLYDGEKLTALHTFKDVKSLPSLGCLNLGKHSYMSNTGILKTTGHTFKLHKDALLEDVNQHYVGVADDSCTTENATNVGIPPAETCNHYTKPNAAYPTLDHCVLKDPTVGGKDPSGNIYDLLGAYEPKDIRGGYNRCTAQSEGRCESDTWTPYSCANAKDRPDPTADPAGIKICCTKQS